MTEPDKALQSPVAVILKTTCKISDHKKKSPIISDFSVKLIKGYRYWISPFFNRDFWKSKSFRKDSSRQFLWSLVWNLQQTNQNFKSSWKELSKPKRVRFYKAKTQNKEKYTYYWRIAKRNRNKILCWQSSTEIPFLVI